MPWSTPTLRDVRSLVRDQIHGSLPGADALIPNSVLRVLSDCQGALCHLTLQYIDWLALQLLPDTAEVEWLDRHADIWLVNADGSTGRKPATFTTGTISISGQGGTVVPLFTRFAAVNEVEYETTEELVLGTNVATPGSVRALDPGIIGNQEPGTTLGLVHSTLVGITGAEVIELGNGVDEEEDDDLRFRVLERIRQPPMGGSQHDYVQWALAVPGVTRAWCAPLEMGIGTVTIRFMCDDLRPEFDGFPTPYDVQQVSAYLNTVRPVAVKEVYVVAPIPQRVDVFISNLTPDTPTIRAAVEQSLQDMLYRWAAPGQTIYAAWKYHAIMETPGVEHFDLVFAEDNPMPSPGHMPILGDITYDLDPIST